MSKPSTFRWTFEPKNLFRLGDDELKYEFDDYRLVIRDSEAEAVVQDLQVIDGWPNVHDTRKAIQRGVEQILDSQAIWEHETYTLSSDGYDIPEPVNREMDHALRISPTMEVRAVLFAEFEVRGPDGEITYDKVRIQRSKELGTLVYRHADDPWASFIISRYRRAIEDPEREFVHLYDILEALRKRFGSRDDDIKANLDLPDDIDAKLGSLGYLANEAPVFQGRHPGNKVGQLRDATEDERKVARQVAPQLIFGYLTYLANDES